MKPYSWFKWIKWFRKYCKGKEITLSCYNTRFTEENFDTMCHWCYNMRKRYGNDRRYRKVMK